MATKAEKDAYAAKLRQIGRSLGRVERETLEQSIRLLRSVRDQVAGQLTGTEFSQFRVAEQQAAIDDIIASYENQARALANGSTRQAFTLGEQSAIEPLQSAGVELAFFRPSEAQVNIISQFSADLIGGKIAPELRHAINRSIQMNALGGNSSLDAMRDINDALFKSQRPPSPRTQQPVKGIAYEAERILRTEVNRSYNLAAHAQQEQLAKDVPGLRKQWMATADGRTRLSHLLAHGDVVPVDDPFIVGGSELMYPGDPAGPASETINCRCTVATVIPELEDTSLVSDEKIAAELEKRGEAPAVVEPEGIASRNFNNNLTGANKWTDGYYKESADKWTSDERDAVKQYQELSYRPMNQLLRGQYGTDDERIYYEKNYRNEINNVTSAINKSRPLDGPTTVYRGIPSSLFSEESVGVEFIDQGFTSTSLVEKVAGEAARFSSFDFDDPGALMEITLPKGTRAAGMVHGGANMAAKEAELLLAPNTRFRITGVIERLAETDMDEFRQDMMRVFQVEVLP